MPWVAPRRPLTDEPSKRSSEMPGRARRPIGSPRRVEGVNRDHRDLGRDARQHQALLPRRDRADRLVGREQRLGGRGLGRSPGDQDPVSSVGRHLERHGRGDDRAPAARPARRAARPARAPPPRAPTHATRARGRVAGHGRRHDRRRRASAGSASGTGCPRARLGDRAVPARASSIAPITPHRPGGPRHPCAPCPPSRATTAAHPIPEPGDGALAGARDGAPDEDGEPYCPGCAAPLGIAA